MNDTKTKAPVFIIGYMGCGKTTLGRALAKALGREFIDLDFYISQRFRSSIPEIFEKKGETEFRRMEAEMLREVGEIDSVVVACGGGTPCFSDNMDYMNSRGFTVWLQASEERLLRRLTRNRSGRPLLAGKSDNEIAEAIAKGLAERECHYSKAQAVFTGDELENRYEIANTVKGFRKCFEEYL